ncbi:MAG TPA: AraC family transcriptional regulator, partial [Phycicoccus sp.]|nr:AraC family transcriptional regulator [Phycicoccus sp.]
MTLRSVAVILQDPVSAFEFGVLDEVFGTDRMDEGVPPIDFRVCAETPEVALDIRFGVTLRATHDLTGTADADLVAVP